MCKRGKCKRPSLVCPQLFNEPYKEFALNNQESVVRLWLWAGGGKRRRKKKGHHGLAYHGHAALFFLLFLLLQARLPGPEDGIRVTADPQDDGDGL